MVRFDCPAALASAVESFIRQGSLLVGADTAPAAGERFELRLDGAAVGRAVALECEVIASPGPRTFLLRIASPSAEVVVSALESGSVGGGAADEDPPSPEPDPPPAAAAVDAPLPVLGSDGKVWCEGPATLESCRQQLVDRGAFVAEGSLRMSRDLTIAVQLPDGEPTEPIEAVAFPLSEHVVVVQPSGVRRAVELLEALVASCARVGAVAVDEAPEEGPAPEVDSAPLEPPTLDDEGVVRFADARAFDQAIAQLERLGAVLAHGRLAGPRRGRVRVAIGSLESPELEADCYPSADGQVVIHFADPSAIAEAAVSLVRARMSQEASAREPAGSRGEVRALPAESALRPISDPREILGVATADPGAPPTALDLVQWVGKLGCCHRLEVRAGRATETCYVDGREIHGRAGADGLGRILALDADGYRTEAVDSVPPTRSRSSYRSLLLETLRAAVRLFDEDALRTALVPDDHACPRLNTRGQEIIGRLGLTAAQRRLADRALDGSCTADALAAGGAGRRSAWEMLYLLARFGGLDWVEVEGESRHQTDPVRRHWELISGKDLFGALGLHWSSHPGAVARAVRKLERLYGPDGSERGESPEWADRIWARVQEARRELVSPGSRRAYRKRRYPALSFEYQAQLMVGQARLAMMRGELETARELLEAALDVAEVEEARELLAAVEAREP